VVDMLVQHNSSSIASLLCSATAAAIKGLQQRKGEEQCSTLQNLENGKKMGAVP
jgi:hypothetical protein